MPTYLKAGIAAFVVQIVLSGIFYAGLMADRFAVWEAAVMRAEPQFLPGLVGFLLISLIMAVMYPKGYQGGDPLKEGARMGLLVGGILTGLVLIHYSAYELQLAGIIADIVFNVALFAVAGAVIGKIYEGAEPQAG